MPLNLRPSDSSLAIMADLIHEKTGLEFVNSRMDLLADKLTLLISDQGFDSVLDYYYFLKYDPLAAEEWKRLYSALAVNETYFWREYDQIRATVEVLVPRLLRERPGVPVRIWHAACATGEEPYSLAIALNEAGCYKAGEVVIHATDFNLHALQQAQAGVYRRRSFRSIPPDILLKYFSAQENQSYRLTKQITECVAFSYLNLLDGEAMAEMRNYDIIFCRNVFIYFSNDSISRVLKWLEQSLNPSGMLFVAAAESLLQLTRHFELVEIGDAFGYQKQEKGSPE